MWSSRIPCCKLVCSRWSDNKQFVNCKLYCIVIASGNDKESQWKVFLMGHEDTYGNLNEFLGHLI